MSSISIVHYVGATAKSHSVLASLAKDSVAAGNDVSVIDLTPTTVIAQGFPPGWLARLFGHRVTESALEGELEQLQVPLIPLTPKAAPEALSPSVEEGLLRALESELLTYFRLDHIPSTREAEQLRARLHTAMLRTYGGLLAMWTQSRPDVVYIPNGRTSRQKAARLVAEHLGIEIRLFENGRAIPDAYYLGKTQPHDRLASQQEIIDGFPLPTGKELIEVAQSWLAHRMSGDGRLNSFSGSWEETAPGDAPPGPPRAVFFASSFDEFRAFGPMWSIDEWESQFDAFDRMMTILEYDGVDIALRLHPNLASKSRKYFLRETEEVLALKAKHPTLTVYWHNDSQNSYDLVRTADYVIVERSTIGLEASLMGKPVWVTQASQWDLIADVRALHTPSDITAEIMKPWTVSPIGAEKFVAYWVSQEHPLHYDWRHWASWNPDYPPFLMKVAQLALPNSLRHKARLVRLELTKRRNLRFTPPLN